MTGPYIGLVHKDARSCWGVTVPDCPGCTAAGDTMDAALSSAAEAVALWVASQQEAGHPAPNPRSLEDVLADPNVKTELASGAVAVPVPAYPA